MKNDIYNTILKEAHGPQLETFLHTNLKGRRNFTMKILMQDELPETFSKYFGKTNLIFIVNLDEARSHWVLIYKELHSPLIYFDSYGTTKIPKNIKKLLFSTPAMANANRLQSGISLICGQYALFFAYCLYYNIASFDGLLGLFNEKNLLLNDLLIASMIM